MKKKIYSFGFIGAGRMASAIFQGMLRSRLTSPKEILISERVEKFFEAEFRSSLRMDMMLAPFWNRYRFT